MLDSWKFQVILLIYFLLFFKELFNLFETRVCPFIRHLLEALVESFFWNLLEFGQHIWFDVLSGCEMCPLEANFQSREQPKVTRSEIRGYGHWAMTGMCSLVRNYCTTSDVWLSVLSWCRNHCLCHLSCRFLWTASRNLFKTCTLKWPITLSRWNEFMVNQIIICKQKGI
jgi:hypothetical protein